ncbi:MAG: hypothetical protein P4L57_03920 [Rhizomicrobium sp.]|nr:hypothetical protein [Rhizomicrobium sp.]
MKTLFSRRNLLVGVGTAAVVAGVGYEATRVLRKRYAPSPYDDLLAKLDDRDGSAQIGEAVLAEVDDFDAKAVAAQLRAKLVQSSLADLATADAAAERLLEAHGWVLPQSLALLCALAAKAAA